MLAPSMRMERKANSTVRIIRSIPAPFASARTESRKPMPITATSRSSHRPQFGLRSQIIRIDIDGKHLPCLYCAANAFVRCKRGAVLWDSPLSKIALLFVCHSRFIFHDPVIEAQAVCHQGIFRFSQSAITYLVPLELSSQKARRKSVLSIMVMLRFSGVPHP